MKGMRPRRPKSSTSTTWGCRTAAATRASVSKRAAMSARDARWGCITFSATWRPRGSWTASYTVPKLPMPSTRRTL